MTSFYDAFISYGRADSKAFASRLSEQLTAAGMRVWFDFNDIPPAVDFQQEISQGIQASHNFIFIISPHAVHSDYCRIELEQALRWHKRIIPIMHVAEVSRDVWQQRYPQGSDRDWQTFCDRGLHTSFDHLHPSIRRLNWIDALDGIDDLDTVVPDTVQLCQHEHEYVEQHTVLLTQALAWQAQQRQPELLLIGEDRQQAEAWLQRRFHDKQPPCVPTDLHCEFITESTKNANNLMTQVFLAFAEDDRAIAQQVRQSLMRRGITIWSSERDIESGRDYQTAINEGIEAADNLILMLSPAALQSSYCCQELDYAASLNKRIIPILVAPVAPETLPPVLTTLQYIDFADRPLDATQLQSRLHEKAGELVRVLRQDETYFSQHKGLLVKALKWERQHRNPTMLLRGSSLREAESWWQLAQGRSRHQPTALQAEFITESLRSPPASTLDVFISYSRTDSGFARTLNEALQVQGKTTWFDQESIPAGADFQAEIHSGIEQSNHFLFILSPSAVTSPYCAAEVDYAQQLNKRIVTVLHRSVDSATLPPALAAIQWLDFSRGTRQFSRQFEQLIRTLDTDQEHLRIHTRLLLRAIEWRHQQLKESLLLRGDDLESAETWFTESLDKQPRPTPLQAEYLQASRIADDAHQKQVIATLTQARQQANQRLRLGSLGMMLMMAIGALLGGLLFRAVQVARAESQLALSQVATAQQEKADIQFELETTRRQARTQIQRLQQQLDPTLESTGDEVPEATNALETTAPQAFTRGFPGRVAAALGPATAVTTAGANPGAGNRFSSDRETTSPTTSPTADTSGPLTRKRQLSYLYDLTGQQLVELEEGSPRFSPDGQYLVTTSPTAARDVSLLHTADGERLASITGRSPQFSPTGRQLVTTTDDQSRLYQLPSLQFVELRGRYPVFSPSEQQLATYDDRQSYLYTPFGTFLRAFPGRYPQFSADGQWLLTSEEDTTYLHRLTTEEAAIALAGHSPTFSPDYQQIAVTAPNNTTSDIYDLTTQQRLTLVGGFPRFTADGRYIITHQDRSSGQSQSRVSYLYQSSGDQLATFPGSFRALSPDLQFVLATTAQQSALYTLQGEQLASYEGRFPRFSPDGRFVLTVAEGNRSYFYEAFTGAELAQLRGQNPTFSPNGRYVLTHAADTRESYLYDLTAPSDLSAEPLRVFRGRFPRFNPNGSRLATDQFVSD